MFHTENEWLDVISISENYVPKTRYVKFENTIEKLCEFIRIFKADLQNIEIDKKENHEYYVCDLIMVYDSYKIHAEFESTGIKKLIRLFAFIREMVNGGIVFIDEFDSNLHDVYLCALLEYLMQYGEGQLCFTTHNVGPMDILKQNKKSIDFLSEARNFLEDAQKYCAENGHEFVWFCKDIEQVYLGKQVEDAHKKAEAAAFKNKKLIMNIRVNQLSGNSYRVGTSNLMCVLDQFEEFARKE